MWRGYKDSGDYSMDALVIRMSFGSNGTALLIFAVLRLEACGQLGFFFFFNWCKLCVVEFIIFGTGRFLFSLPSVGHEI